MSLTVLPDLIQGSEEWHAQRRGIVTASVVGKLITPSQLRPANNDTSRGLTAQLVAERITGYTEPTYVNADMLRGVEDEPRAVAVYAQHYAPVTTIGFMLRDNWGFRIGCSPDGLVGDDGMIEVKSRRQKEQLATILADEVPSENMAQCQAALLVSGREWLDYVSFCSGMPLYTKRVLPDEQWHGAIILAVEKFEMEAERMVAAYERAVAGLPMTERVAEMEIAI